MIKCKLGDILDVKRGMSLSGQFYSDTGDRIRLTLGNFNYPAGGFKENTSKSDIYFTGEVRPEFILKKGDIITPLTEQVAGLLGETAIIPEDDLYIQSGDIGLIVPNEEVLNRSFAYYLVSSPSVRKQLGAAAQQTKIRHTSPEKIKDCEVWIPDLRYQELAGRLLSAIDSKIKINTNINAELESMAKTIYDYWFLQFEFPNEEGKPYKSSGGKMVWNDEVGHEIPEGWAIKSIFEVSDILYGHPFSTEKFSKNGKYPLVRIRDIPSNSISAYTNEKADIKFTTKETDLLIGMDGNFYMNFWCEDGDYINQRIARIRDKYPVSALQIYFEIMPIIKAKEKNVARSTVGHLSDKDIKELNIINTNNRAIYNTFDAILTNICKKKKENQSLSALRDFLLPLLMNGQVGFKDE